MKIKLEKTIANKLNSFIVILFCLFYINNANAQTQKVSLVYAAGINDIMSNGKGNYAQLASIVATKRAEDIPAFFIYGGSSLSPSILGRYDRGFHIIDLLNMLSPDVMSASNNDFGYFEEELSLRAFESEFPLVVSNVKNSQTKMNLDGLLSSVIIEQGPYKLGYISLVDETIVENFNLPHSMVINHEIAIKSEAKKLRAKGAELIILSYEGNTLNIFETLNDDLVDLVLRKNEHQKDYAKELQQHPKELNLNNADDVAIIELSWQQNNPQSLTAVYKQIPLSSLPKDPLVQKRTESYINKMSVKMNSIIGSTTNNIALSREVLRSSENAFANLLTDLIKEHTQADISLLNSGMIRGGGFYPQNYEFSRGDILKIIPYEDTAVLINVTGTELLSVLEHGFSKVDILSGRYPQVSGMQVVYDSKADIGERVISVKVNGKPLNPLTNYKMAITQYLANGGDGFALLKEKKPLIYNHQMSRIISEMLIDKLLSNKSISPELLGRITDINNKSGI